MKTRVITAIITVIVSTLAIWVVISSLILFDHNADAQQIPVTRILVGGGNNTYPFYGYDPQQVEIKAGSTIVWSVPSMAPLEPHTVSFVFSNKTFASPFAPFSVPSSTQFAPLPHVANSKPNMIPGKNGTSTVIVNNAMSYRPASIDSTGNAKLLGQNTNLVILGNERYVNSGWLVPKGSEQILPGSSNTFAATFPKVGTYSYTCSLHPWMVGKVVVK